MTVMAVEKMSISLSVEVAERARRAAAYEGIPLSTWLSRAAEEAAGLAEARAAMADYIEQYGEPDPEVTARSLERLAAAGVGELETPEETAARLAVLARLRGELPENADSSIPSANR
jgi:hypothetical protein